MSQPHQGIGASSLRGDDRRYPKAKLALGLLAQQVDPLELAVGLEVLERPAVAGRLALDDSAQSVNGSLIAAPTQRSVGFHLGANLGP